MLRGAVVTVVDPLPQLKVTEASNVNYVAALRWLLLVAVVLLTVGQPACDANWITDGHRRHI